MSTESISWNIEELHGIVTRKYGASHAAVLQTFLNSTSKKIRIAAYHSQESREMMKEFFPHENEIENYTQGFDLVFGHMTANIEDVEKERSVLFHNTLWKAEAHVVACAHAIQSLIDIMWQVINCALNLRIDVNDVTLYQVQIKVQGHEGLYNLLLDLKNNETYKYLSAFVNSQKHIYFVPATFTLQAELKEGERAYGLKIPQFTFKNQHYSEKWSEDFVTTDFVLLKDKIIAVGIELNNILRN